jgi:hypothetical protein
VFGRVQDAIDPPPRPADAPGRVAAPPLRRRRFVRPLAATLATAAAALVALYLRGPTPVPDPKTDRDPAPAQETFALATDADVEVISIDDRDAGQILVGRLPLARTDAVVLAAGGEVELKGIQKAEDGMVPKAMMNEAGNAPMIIAPVAGR